MSVPYEEQLRQKRAQVRAALLRFPDLASPEVTPCAGATPPVEYRTRAKLVVGPDGKIGLYAPGTHRVVDLPRCAALSPRMRRVADAVREELAAFRIAPYQPARGVGVLRYLDLRESQREQKVHATLVLRADSLPLEAEEVAESLLARVPELSGVAANLNPSDQPQVLGATTVHVAGNQFIWEDIDKARVRYSPGTFSQAHRGQAEHLVRRVRALLAPSKEHWLVDLYSGVGMFSLAMRNEVAGATLIESFPAAAEDARAAAAGASWIRAHVVARPAESALSEIPRGKLLCVVNPPRRGLAPEVVEAIARRAPDRVAYVSCDPETMARDLDLFARLGLRLAAPLEPVDMIPLTEEVESLALLRPGEPPELRVLFQDEHLVIIDKPWGFSTHKSQADEDDVQSRLESQLGRRVGPIHRLDRETSGAAFFALSQEAARRFGRLMESHEIEREYLALVRGRARPRGVVNRPLKEQGQERFARTRYRLLATPANHSLVAVELETGRTHQIRRHMEGIGHPVVGDDRYGHAATNRHFRERYGLVRPFLHSHRAAFEHPFTGEIVRVRAYLPGDLATVLARSGEPELADDLQGRQPAGEPEPNAGETTLH
jgi:23S rRNA (uracil1939-C5)-methyltransferase